MAINIAFMVFIAASLAWFSMRALHDHRSALSQRGGLLDRAVGLLGDAKITLGRDAFPVLVGRLPDKRPVKVELIADTMVFRRLPQLWLRVTLTETVDRKRPSIGALARPTGAEFYSIVHELPHWIEPPQTDASLLMRGDGNASEAQIERVSALFRSLFSDPAVKEAAITPRGVRLIRQAAQGDRGAHLILRQTQFRVDAIAPELVQAAIREAETLRHVLPEEQLVPAAMAV
jgi:hypothetical protein